MPKAKALSAEELEEKSEKARKLESYMLKASLRR
jgi:hypothetical protein